MACGYNEIINNIFAGEYSLTTGYQHNATLIFSSSVSADYITIQRDGDNTVIAHGVTRNVADWSDFCFRAASRYRDQIHHWEVWNEPNLPGFWSGSRAEYLRTILVPAAAAIHAANPEAKVGGPALAHHAIEGRDWHGWLVDVLREAGGSLDFLTHHAYDLDDPAGVFARLSGTTDSSARV